MLGAAVAIVLLAGREADAQPTQDSPQTAFVQPAGPAPNSLHPYDWNNDGCDDLIAREADTQQLWLLIGTCSPGVITQFNTGVLLSAADWSDYDAFALVGDWDGFGCADFLARNAVQKRLEVFFGNCTEGISGSSFVLDPFDETFDGVPYDWLLGIGSWNGDGCPDFAARHGIDLDILMSNCAASIATVAGAGGDWSVYDWLLGPNHWDANDVGVGGSFYCTDLIGRELDGDLIWTDQACGGGLYPSEQIGNGWQNFSWLLSGGDWAVGISSCPDILGRLDTDLLLYRGNCSGGFTGSATEIGSNIDWSKYDYILGDAGPILSNNNGGTPTPTPSSSPSATPTHTPTTTPTGLPTPSPTSTALPLKGDANCNGIVNLNDVRTMLAAKAAIPGSPPPGCNPNLNLDCTGGFTSIDILALTMQQADIVYPLPSGCTAIGAPVG